MKKPSGKKQGNGSGLDLPSAQDRFLSQMISERTRVAVFLASGVRLEGQIVSFDQFVILMKGAVTDKVYKHAVSTIQPVEEGHQASDGGPRERTSRVPLITRRTRPRLARSAGDKN
jgi:host factor-I protein